MGSNIFRFSLRRPLIRRNFGKNIGQFRGRVCGFSHSYQQNREFATAVTGKRCGHFSGTVDASGLLGECASWRFIGRPGNASPVEGYGFDHGINRRAGNKRELLDRFPRDSGAKRTSNIHHDINVGIEVLR